MSRSLREYGRDLGFNLSRRLNYPLVKPDWVSLIATLRCNLSCSMCRTCYNIDRELSLAEIRSVIDQVADWGVTIFNLLGGEPFLRRDILPILEHAHGRDLITTVTTNGTLLDETRIRALAPLNQVHLNVSLDGLEGTHDGIRGRGVFRKATTAIEQIVAADEEEATRRERAGQPWWPREITINTIVHGGNLGDILPLMRQVRGLGATGVQLLALFDFGEETRSSDLWVGERSLASLDRTVDELIAWFERQDRFRCVNPPGELQNFKRYYRGQLTPLEAPCYNGFKELYINADGEGLMCDGRLEFLSDSFGNVRSQDIRTMWIGAKAQQMRRKVLRCGHACTQDCYRRRESDSLAAIARGASSRLLEDLAERMGSRGTV